jgi:CubicO group peptidase (beta-lactamase class C family)
MVRPAPAAASGLLARRLQDLLDRTVAEDPAIQNGVMRIDAPHFTWQGASGMADPDGGVAMLPDDQFQAASITKMVTAATLMTVVEEGRIELDAGIGRYLPASVISGLHHFAGRDYAPEITPRQLLSHTSASRISSAMASRDPAAPCRSSPKCSTIPTSCGIRSRSWRGPSPICARASRRATAGTMPTPASCWQV